jgi:hypothetical protein
MSVATALTTALPKPPKTAVVSNAAERRRPHPDTNCTPRAEATRGTLYATAQP